MIYPAETSPQYSDVFAPQCVAVDCGRRTMCRKGMELKRRCELVVADQ